MGKLFVILPFKKDPLVKLNYRQIVHQYFNVTCSYMLGVYNYRERFGCANIVVKVRQQKTRRGRTGRTFLEILPLEVPDVTSK